MSIALHIWGCPSSSPQMSHSPSERALHVPPPRLSPLDSHTNARVCCLWEDLLPHATNPIKNCLELSVQFLQSGCFSPSCLPHFGMEGKQLHRNRNKEISGQHATEITIEWQIKGTYLLIEVAQFKNFSLLGREVCSHRPTRANSCSVNLSHFILKLSKYLDRVRAMS